MTREGGRETPESATPQGLTVLVCTYNRAPFLRETLAALLRLHVPRSARTEILVVDNNSNDSTPEVIESAAAASPVPIRVLFEPRQGKSYALNRGLADARGDVIALTDDDVVPARDWLQRIVEAFSGEDISFVFGKVLPRWGATPPPELLARRAKEIWGPLAILDYGDEPISYTAQATGQRLPVGANLAFRRSVLESVGGWRTDLGKVDNSLISGEDHEIFFRLRRGGLYAGLYDPSNIVWHYVPPSRLTRRYFRRWFYWHGKTLARIAPDIYDTLDLDRVPHIAGVPRFVLRQFAEQVFHWVLRLGSRDALGVLIEELQAIEYLGFVVQKLQHRRGRKTPDRNGAPFAPLPTAINE